MAHVIAISSAMWRFNPSGPFGIFRLIGLFVYGINRATLQEPFGIPRLKGLCGYGIRRVVTNVDERDILPRIIINELD